MGTPLTDPEPGSGHHLRRSRPQTINVHARGLAFTNPLTLVLPVSTTLEGTLLRCLGLSPLVPLKKTTSPAHRGSEQISLLSSLHLSTGQSAPVLPLSGHVRPQMMHAPGCIHTLCPRGLTSELHNRIKMGVGESLFLFYYPRTSPFSVASVALAVLQTLISTIQTFPSLL